ncbi:hypothetical protein ACL9RL_07050 [Plantibacter sp. Mn2098]|uniref:hypothetical protein n=1 Tax=Plantibacter sp. Mn2098 TaxID=3395266 RepID=UPI003BEB80B9
MTNISFDLQLRRIDVQAIQQEVDDETLEWRSFVTVNSKRGSALVLARLVVKNRGGRAQGLGVAFLPEKDRYPEGTLSEANVVRWVEEVGAELLYDLCRQALLAQAGAMNLELDLPAVPPVVEPSVIPE